MNLIICLIIRKYRTLHFNADEARERMVNKRIYYISMYLFYGVILSSGSIQFCWGLFFYSYKTWWASRDCENNFSFLIFPFFSFFHKIPVFFFARGKLENSKSFLFLQLIIPQSKSQFFNLLNILVRTSILLNIHYLQFSSRSTYNFFMLLFLVHC